MGIRRVLLLILFALVVTCLDASERGDSTVKKVSFAYDVDFDTYFDNREYYKSKFSKSKTIFASRLTPLIGLNVSPSDGSSHKIMLGIDILKNFGENPVDGSSSLAESSDNLLNSNLFQELTFYYNFSKRVKDIDLSLTAGVFPYKFADGTYSGAFFSDEFKFYNNNMEGILFSLQSPKTYFELGCDWIGLYGQYRRERFLVFSSMDMKINDFISFNYDFYLYHYACSRKVDGVVDNILVNPYFVFDAAKYLNFQEFSASVGWVQAFQHDREHVGHYVFPGGGQVVLDIKKWGVGINNMIYCGTDLMPYYKSKDAGGYVYGSDLYHGDTFYRVFDELGMSQKCGIYDRLEVYYEPKIGDYLSIKLSAIFHFNQGYSGCQQMIGLNFNLQELLNIF